MTYQELLVKAESLPFIPVKEVADALGLTPKWVLQNSLSRHLMRRGQRTFVRSSCLAQALGHLQDAVIGSRDPALKGRVARRLRPPNEEHPYIRMYVGPKVYFIEGAGMVKIGLSENPESRLMDLRNHSPVPLTLVGAIRGSADLEQLLHGRFRELRSHGEWFFHRADLVEMTESVRRAAGIEDATETVMSLLGIPRKVPQISAEANSSI